MGSRMSLALRRAGVAALLVLIVGALISGACPVAAATAPDPTVQVVPSAVTLAPGDVTHVALVLDNPTNAQVTVGNVRVLTPPHVTVGTVSGVPQTLAPGSSSIATFDVQVEPGFGENQVSIIAELGEGTSARQVVTSLTVKPAAGPATPEASFVVFPSKLNDGDSRRATVRLTNPAGVTFTKLRLLAVDSDDAYLSMSQPLTTVACTAETGERLLTCVGDLPAGASVLVDLEVRSLTSVRTGTQQVGVVLRGTPVTTSGAAAREVAAVATHDVELAVFGVDAISPFGAGTLFLLPGLLAIAVFLTATRFMYPRRTSGLPDKVDPKDLSQMPAIAVVGVIVYMLVWFFWREDLTRRVSTAAVERVFALGILIGVGAWALMAVLYRQFVGRRRFSVDDTEPAGVLLTLKHRHAGLAFPSYRTEKDEIRLHLGHTDGMEYFAPQITFDLGQCPPEQEPRFRKAYRASDIATILSLHKERKVTLAWRTGSGLEVHDPTSMPVLGQKKDLLLEKE